MKYELIKNYNDNDFKRATGIPIEHVNCQVKIFRISAERYRSRTDTFCLMASIIFCFYNFCL